MPELSIAEMCHPPMEQQAVEIVERKGLGHPDTICDAIMEEVSVALCREYMAAFGRILHHNIDKGMLVAGLTDPRPGGGRVLQMMKILFCDRATANFQGKRIDVEGIAEDTARKWIHKNLRFVDPGRNILFQNELKRGSPELISIFERDVIVANDTAAAIGYAPLSETEQIVLATEHYLNSPEFKGRFPESGEDVKVMAYRQGGALLLTVSMAFVDKLVPDSKTYFEQKARMAADVEEFLSHRQKKLDSIQVMINTLDDPGRGDSGMYLTVLGTSAEGADGGVVGRGNRVNGLIALNRPANTEAAAGKNPVSHVGKIYSVLASRMAAEVYDQVPGINEVNVWLCSQIGQPIDRPKLAAVQLSLQGGTALADVQAPIQAVFEQQLGSIRELTQDLAAGKIPVW
jgi:S-adenosylmethionine synthetase